MSVQCNQYLCYGYVLNIEDLRSAFKASGVQWEDAWEAFCDEHHDSAFKSDIVQVDGASVLISGMTGHCFLGKVYAKSKTGDLLDSCVIPSVRKKDKEAVARKYQSVFGGSSTPKATLQLFTMYR